MQMMGTARSAYLRAQGATYDASLRPSAGAPPGYRSLSRSRVLPAGLTFEAAAGRLLHWRIQRGAGVRVRPSSERVAEGVVVDLVIGLGRLAVTAPCRVVEVVDVRDADGAAARCGFTYVTLPGHPEAGVESFTVSRRKDGRSVLTIEAVSRPATLLTRVGGPLGHLAQQLVTTRYLRALDEPG